MKKEEEEQFKNITAWAIPDVLLERKDLDMTEKVLIAIMMRLGALEKPIHPSQKWLAQKMGMSRIGITKVLKRLKEKGIVKYEGKVWKLASYSLFLEYPKYTRSGIQSIHDSGIQSIHDKRDIQSRDIQKENIILHSKPEFAGSDINYLIGLFKEINPNYEHLFSNKTQRSALERLVKKFGKEKVEKMIKFLPKIFGRPYAPIITTPLELEKKLANLIAFLQKEKMINERYKIAKI
ncbi:MAG: hypothetical protein QW228_05720 [Candidatus Aenigmatarchaeota archaeon]